MRVIYLSGVDRKRDAATVAQLSELDSRLEVTTVSSPPDAFSRAREDTEIAALITSAGVARSEILSLLVSLRRDKVDVAVFPVVSESQREFATAALAAGANDVILQLGDTLINPGDALSLVLEARQTRRPANLPLLRVLYAGSDQLVWNLLEQVPFVKRDRVSNEAVITGNLGGELDEDGTVRCDVVLVDAQSDLDRQAQAVQSVQKQTAEVRVLALVTPNAPEPADTLGLSGDDVIPKTGLYRRPLVTALERIHKTMEVPVASSNGSGPDAAPDMADGSARVVLSPTPIEVTPASITTDETVVMPRPEPAMPADDSPDGWQAERAELEAKLTEATDELESLAAAREQLDQAREQLETLQSHHEIERDEWQVVRQNIEMALEATRTELREAIDRHRAEREALETAVGELQARAQSLEESQRVERARWEEATGTLEERLRAAATAAARAEFEEALEANRQELQRLEASHDEERRLWTQERDGLSARLAQLERGGAEAQAEARTLAESLTAELETARTELAAAHQARDADRIAWEQAQQQVGTERDEAVAALARQAEDIAAARAEHEVTRTERDALRQQLDASLRERDEARAALDAERAQTDARLADARRTAGGATEQLQQMLDATRAELDAIRADRDAARSELDRQQNEYSTAIRERDDARGALDAERAQIDVRLADARDAAAGAAEQLQQALDAARAELDTLRADRDAARGELDRQQNEYSTATRERDDARAALDAERAQIEARLAEARLIAGGTAEQLQQTLEATRAELDALRADRDAARGELDRQRDELPTIIHERDDARAALHGLRRELDEVREAARRASDEWASEREALEREAKDARAASDAARRELDAARTHLEEATRWHESQRSSWDTARQHLEADAAAREAQLVAARDELEARLRDAGEREATLTRRIDALTADQRSVRQREVEHLAQFVRRGPFGYCTTTREGRLLSCNETMAHILGYRSADDMLSAAGQDPLPAFAGTRALDARLLSAAHTDGAEIWLERIDGQPVRVLESAALVNAPDTGEQVVERVFIDLSGYRALEERLDAAQRIGRVGALATEMAPDLESLLASVADAGPRIAGRLEAGDPRRAELDQMTAEARQAGDLVRQLLAFSRRQQRPTAPVDLNAVIERLKPMLDQLVGADVRFEHLAGPSVPVGVAEEDLQQLLTALVVRARDLLPIGGTVRVETAVVDAADLPGPTRRRAVLGVQASGYGVRTAPISETLTLMIERCGATAAAADEPGRLARIDVTFSRPQSGPDRT